MIAFLPGVDHGAHISDVEFGGQSQSNATASLSATDLARRCPRPSRRITGRSPPLRVHAIRRMLARWVPGTTCWRGAAAVATFTHTRCRRSCNASTSPARRTPNANANA
jgi:hypothetical protein